MISFILKSIVSVLLLTTVSYDKTPPFSMEKLDALKVKGEEFSYDKAPPYTMDKLEAVEVNGKTAYQPKEDYSMFVNYELGMHCVGFDMSYCCIIPPYNSIQSQVIKVGKGTTLPKLMNPGDNVKVFAYTRDNTFSEGNKMKYWMVAKDADGDGHLDSPGDNVANYVWTHLFIYKDLEGTLPYSVTEKDRFRIGRQLQVKVDHGPLGAPMTGYMSHAGKDGGNVVFSDTLIPAVKDLKLVLTSSHLWDALGLPLTAFNDSTRKGSLRSVTEKDFQPFQYSTVELHTSTGKQIKQPDGQAVSYFGTNPIDIPNCYSCHSREGEAAQAAREEGLTQADEEYNYWKKYPDTSEYMARLSEGSINILALHDLYHRTTFLSDYRNDAPSQRLGKVGFVNCTDCHGDNISGNILTPRPTASGYKTKRTKSLSEAIHGFHLSTVPMPDAADRSQACQSCHPTHFQNPNMNDDTNPFRVTDKNGKGRFSKGDIRTSGGGCYVRRDAHSNPDAKPPFFLNAYGKWQLENVATKDEHGKDIGELRGLYCTNCHTKVAQKLYAYDDLTHDSMQKGKTLRNKTLKEIIDVVAEGDAEWFSELADPKTSGYNEVLSYYEEHESATLVKNIGKDGKLNLKPWNHPTGQKIPYSAVSAGDDWWLSPSQPHCADCHLAPFVEQDTGGKYFPIDQPNKYSLYRYSKAHGNLACQTCHESQHGLYSTRYDGDERSVDVTTHQQALQYSPDGKYTGPVTCSACHTVNKSGVPVQLVGTEYEHDYWASVTLSHFMREGDQKLSVKELIKKYPYSLSSKIVKEGWK